MRPVPPKRLIIHWTILACFVCCLSVVPSFAATGPFPETGWRSSTPEEQGMGPGRLADMLEEIDEEGFGIDSITIIRNGYMVVDAYFFPFEKGLKHIMHSCTKSITSALVGIAIDQGHIRSISQPILDFFPKESIRNLNQRKRTITLEHLLIMSSGLRCSDSYLYEWKGLWDMKASEDWAQYVLDLPMDQSPGERFEYCNGVSYLLAVILQKATGMRALEFADQYLFGPLGITNVKWRTSPQGIDIGWGEMWLAPHDMAKIGWLYLNKGKWKDRQIVPAAWVEASTRGHISGSLFPRYGYQWWVDDSYYMAAGYRGQFIFVVPGKNMVVVFTGRLIGNDFFAPKELLEKYIISSAVSMAPLPPDPQEDARLRSLLEMCSKGPPRGYIWGSEKEGVAKEGVFVLTASPAFTFTYPKGSTKKPTDSPNQIMAMQTPSGVVFNASALDIPEGMTIADVGPKVIAPLLKRTGSDVQVISNKEIRLRDGARGYRTDIKWRFQGIVPLTTLVVSAFIDGKWVFLATHPWQAPDEVAPIVESLILIEP